jgi:hypothetical protein
MTEQDWNRVIRNNSLMNGNVFSIVENKSREKAEKLEYITKIEKAPYPGISLQLPTPMAMLVIHGNTAQHSSSDQGLLNAMSWTQNPTLT